MVELELLDVVQTEDSPVPFVLLRHEDRILPILVGHHEASAIQLGLMGEQVPRPMTHDLICNILAGLRGELKSVTIYKLENETFFAHLNVEQRLPDGQVAQLLRIDSRPSDGIAIATRVGCPIFAAEEVMDAAAQTAPTGPPEEEGVEGDDEDEDEEEFDV
ncbi:MAG TPA: bifunctional nuclease family protein [Candidatus Hydrogenedentes bacterium]|mgnify:CR=1 FL=1|nr:bifunctional nuclease family protein [Candidatus Hydrogenedentota bacterium]HPG69737.1 bifunctional nuclease family protein [Candidatus Hydrogenedentota bacterium]